MYLGHIVEVANTSNLFSNPQHPYTRSLIETAPQIFRKNKKRTFYLKVIFPVLLILLQVVFFEHDVQTLV